MDDIPTEYNDIHPHPLEPIQVRSVGDETEIAHHHPNANIVATITAKKPTAQPSGSEAEHVVRKITSHLCVNQHETLEQAIKGEQSNRPPKTMHQLVETINTLFKLSQRVSKPSIFTVYKNINKP